LRSRNRRREDTFGVHLPDPVVVPDSDLEPEQEAVLADSVGLALLVVLDSLSPAERLAFVLHDMFELPLEEIAPMLGRTPTAARQLASRARRRVKGRSGTTTGHRPRPAAADRGRVLRRSPQR
jgi:DNA-directed RNA polymerase specialized sigma24 family protein